MSQGIDIGQVVIGSMAKLLGGRTPQLVGGVTTAVPGLVGGTHSPSVRGAVIGAAQPNGLFSPLDTWVVSNLESSKFEPATIFGYPGEVPDAWKAQQNMDYSSFIYGVDCGAVKGLAVGIAGSLLVMKVLIPILKKNKRK